MRIQLHISAVMTLLLLTTVSAAQDMKALKAGVVRIKNNDSGEVGAGFIVGIDQERIYILTASHVVKAAGKPEVYFFNNQFQPLSAEQINSDYDNPKGLALLLVRSPNGQMLAGLATLKFADSSDVNGGEGVKIIGFPASSSFWDVSAGIISHLEGNNLIFAAPIRSGNSGGPVVLSDGRVIGMVTDTTESLGTSSATKAEVLVSYVNGLIPQRVSPNRKTSAEQPEILLGSSDDCTADPKPVPYIPNKAIKGNWLNSNGTLSLRSDTPTMAKYFYVCRYIVRQPIVAVVISIQEGEISFEGPNGTGGGLGLLIYEGEPDYGRTWDDFGNPKNSKFFLWEHDKGTHQSLTLDDYRVEFGKPTTRISIVFALVDAWSGQYVNVKMRGIRIKFE